MQFDLEILEEEIKELMSIERKRGAKKHNEKLKIEKK